MAQGIWHQRVSAREGAPHSARWREKASATVYVNHDDGTGETYLFDSTVTDDDNCYTEPRRPPRLAEVPLIKIVLSDSAPTGTVLSTWACAAGSVWRSGTVCVPVRRRYTGPTGCDIVCPSSGSTMGWLGGATVLAVRLAPPLVAAGSATSSAERRWWRWWGWRDPALSLTRSAHATRTPTRSGGRGSDYATDGLDYYDSADMVTAAMRGGTTLPDWDEFYRRQGPSGRRRESGCARRSAAKRGGWGGPSVARATLRRHAAGTARRCVAGCLTRGGAETRLFASTGDTSVCSERTGHQPTGCGSAGARDCGGEEQQQPLSTARFTQGLSGSVGLGIQHRRSIIEHLWPDQGTNFNREQFHEDKAIRRRSPQQQGAMAPQARISSDRSSERGSLSNDAAEAARRVHRLMVQTVREPPRKLAWVAGYASNRTQTALQRRQQRLCADAISNDACLRNRRENSARPAWRRVSRSVRRRPTLAFAGRKRSARQRQRRPGQTTGRQPRRS